MDQTVIYVATRDSLSLRNRDLYRPIQVGAALTKVKLPYQRDDQGDNISSKNESYCELTALYWIWKNDVFSQVTGLCHYRRFFTKMVASGSERFFLDEEDIASLLRGSDLIVPRRFIWRHDTVRSAFSNGWGRDEDLLMTREVISGSCPSYLTSFDAVVNAHEGHYCNMFVMRKEVLDSYCDWLFAILGYLEGAIDLTGYSQEEKRVFGYLSEILFNVWIEHNDLSRCEVPIVRTSTAPVSRLLSIVKHGKYFIP